LELWKRLELVAFLGYALWVTLKHLLQRQAALISNSVGAAVADAQPPTPMKTLALMT
jgi:hypothetical protein